jgi:hypothetical protein
MSDIDNQFINRGKTITADTRLYRVFPRQWLIDMFSKNLLTLRAPHKWGDPFENFLSKCKATVDGTPNVSLSGLFKNYYGQCWTLNPESDAMWRIYSPANDGARVSTTAGRLLRSIYNAADPFASMSYYIGSVGYETEADLRLVFEDPSNATGVALDATGRGQATTLFLKRKEFEHEAEVRLLYQFNQENFSGQRPEEIWQFAIDTNTLFDDVLFDPRMDATDFRRGEQTLRALGFNNPIAHSTLYQLPNLNITIRTH